jgi:hypothetical protein
LLNTNHKHCSGLRFRGAGFGRAREGYFLSQLIFGIVQVDIIYRKTKRKKEEKFGVAH